MIDKSWQLFSARSSRESGLSRSPSHTTRRAGPHPAVHKVLYQDSWTSSSIECRGKATALRISLVDLPPLSSGSIPYCSGKFCFPCQSFEYSQKIYVLLDIWPFSFDKLRILWLLLTSRLFIGISQGKIDRLHPHSCRIYSHRLLMDTDFTVRCPLVQPLTASRFGFYLSGHGLTLRFLQV